MMLAMHASEADELFPVDCSDFVDAAEVLVKTFKPTGVVYFQTEVVARVGLEPREQPRSLVPMGPCGR